jgi:phosphoglycerol transferase MdoB-like AlkP superfamily enzyme
VQTYGRWLWALTVFFAFRVIAQPLALVIDLPWLPQFESWHSGAMPYPLLVVAQLFILAWLAITAWRVSHNTVRPNRTSGRALLAIAVVYAATMLTRLILGATMLRDERWFGSPLPAVFHLGLAGYLFVFGHLHAREG